MNSDLCVEFLMNFLVPVVVCWYLCLFFFLSLVLGHLSMLLDVVLSPDAKFILTADRQEVKILQIIINICNSNIHSTVFVHPRRS
jgi:hypothetical protein